MAKKPTKTIKEWRKEFQKLADARDFETLLTQAAIFIKKHPNEAEGFVSRGVAKKELGKNNEAKRDFHKGIKLADKSIKSNHENVLAFYSRGDANFALGLYEKAIKDYDNAIRLDPNETSAYIARAHCKKNLDQIEEALKDYDIAIELDPDEGSAYASRGNIKSDLGYHEESINDYDIAIKLNPNIAWTYNNRGSNKNSLGRYQEGIADFNRAIELDPKSAASYNNRGLAKNKLERYEEALTDLDKAIELAPDDPAAYVNRSGVKNNLGHHEAAINDCDKALSLNPRHSKAYTNRASAKNSLDRHQEAIDDCDEAIELDPNSAAAYNNRGFAKNMLGYYDEAIKDFDKAIELEPSNIVFQGNRGASFGLRVGKFTEEKLISAHTQQIQAYLNPNEIINFYEDEIERVRKRLYGSQKGTDDDTPEIASSTLPLFNWLYWFLRHHCNNPIIFLMILWTVTSVVYFCLEPQTTCKNNDQTYCFDLLFFLPSILMSIPLLFLTWHNFRLRKKPKSQTPKAPRIEQWNINYTQASERAYSKYRLFVLVIWVVVATLFYHFHLNTDGNGIKELTYADLLAFTTSILIVTAPFAIYVGYLSRRVEQDTVRYYSLQRDLYLIRFWNAQNPDKLEESNRSQLAPQFLKQIESNHTADISLKMLDRSIFGRKKKQEDISSKLDELTTAIKNLTLPKAE